MSDENAMNVDGDGSISQNDRDVDDIEMESNVIHSGWVSEAGVNEAGWFVAVSNVISIFFLLTRSIGTNHFYPHQ